MKERQQRGARWSIDPVQVDEIAIGRLPTLAAVGRWRCLDEQRVDGLGMPAWQPYGRVAGREGGRVDGADPRVGC